ncbi:MAG TPA: exosortase/archaeosortase family protein [Candidatus Norongarragalinales archaeon]|nr:exosortase/archaeosortase family protein [Candidatus Norongarragalinales archaeon]
MKIDKNAFLALEFLAYFLLFAVPAYLILSFSHSSFLAPVAATSSAALLGAQVVQENGEWFVRSDKFDALISDLCSGALEISVLVGAIVASRDRSRHERLKGAAAGVLAVLLLNPVRIAVTLQQVGSVNFALFHEVLFRLALVVFIVSFYGLWYWLSATPPSTAFKNAERVKTR